MTRKRRTFGTMTDGDSKRPRLMPFLLVLLPLWLAVSGAAGVWYLQHRDKQAEIRGQQRFARTVSEAALADDLRKIVDYIGERHTATDGGKTGLTRTAAMIEGLLGPSNTGYTVRRVRGPGEWPLLRVSLPGSRTDEAAVWVVSSYDSRPGSPGVEANATGLAATLAAAQAIAGDQPAVPVHLVLAPHSNDPGSPVAETAATLRDLILASGPPRAVLCVEAMGGGAELWLTSRDPDAVPLEQARGLGSARGPDAAYPGGERDLATRLHEIGLPAVRVSTRSAVAEDDPDDQLPAPVALASASGRLIELIRRCAAAP